MSADEPFTATAAEPSAVDLIRQTQWDLNHLLGIRRLVFGQPDQHQRLRAFVREQAEGTLQAGLADFVLGRYEEALPILRAHAGEPGVAALLSLSLTLSGRPQEGLEPVSEPKTPDEARARALALFRQEDSEALKKIVEEPGLLEKGGWVPFLKGWFAERENRIDEALQLYHEAHELEPQLQECTFRLARLLDLKGEDDQAIALYESLIVSGPVDVAVLLHLGILYEDREDYRRAEQCYRAILRKVPNHPRARLYLEDVQASRNMVYDEEQERQDGRRNQILRTPITDFELSVRSRNCLDKMGIRTLGDLVTKTEAELLSLKNFGETSLEEIQKILKSKGLRLGLDPDQIGADTGSGGGYAPDDPRSRPIQDLKLTGRANRIIEMFKLRTIGDLCEKTEAELMACPNFGQSSLNEIKNKLDELGLSLRG